MVSYKTVHYMRMLCQIRHCCEFSYRDADKPLARRGRKQANISVRMAWISFGALPCRKKSLWQLASRCWNSGRPWHAPEVVFFLVGLRTYQHLGREENEKTLHKLPVSSLQDQWIKICALSRYTVATREEVLRSVLQLMYTVVKHAYSDLLSDGRLQGSRT